MSFLFKQPPALTGDIKTQMSQLYNYLYQLSEECNYALNTIEKTVPQIAQSSVSDSSASVNAEISSDTFQELKALIIKTGEASNEYSASLKLQTDQGLLDLSKLLEQTNKTVADNKTATDESVASVGEILAKNQEANNSSFLNIEKLIKDNKKAVSDNAVEIAGIKEIQLNMDSEYVAKSEFGTYQETVSSTYLTTADANTHFASLQTEIDTVEEENVGFREWKANNEAYIKSGVQYMDENGVQRFGLAIGENIQVNVDDNTVVDSGNLLTMFVADSWEQYVNGKRMVKVSPEGMNIRNAEIGEMLIVGEFFFQKNADGGMEIGFIEGGE